MKQLHFSKSDGIYVNDIKNPLIILDRNKKYKLITDAKIEFFEKTKHD